MRRTGDWVAGAAQRPWASLLRWCRSGQPPRQLLVGARGAAGYTGWVWRWSRFRCEMQHLQAGLRVLRAGWTGWPASESSLVEAVAQWGVPYTASPVGWWVIVGRPAGGTAVITLVEFGCYRLSVPGQQAQTFATAERALKAALGAWNRR